MTLIRYSLFWGKFFLLNYHPFFDRKERVAPKKLFDRMFRSYRNYLKPKLGNSGYIICLYQIIKSNCYSFIALKQTSLTVVWVSFCNSLHNARALELFKPTVWLMKLIRRFYWVTGAMPLLWLWLGTVYFETNFLCLNTTHSLIAKNGWSPRNFSTECFVRTETISNPSSVTRAI